MKHKWLITCLCLISAFHSTLSWGAESSRLEKGKQVYLQCTGCHTPSYHRTGPRHCELLGRVAGTDAGFTYSEAMKKSKITWSKSTLDEFLSSPLTSMPGTTMGFVGVKDDQDRAALILYLQNLTADNPDCQ